MLGSYATNSLSQMILNRLLSRVLRPIFFNLQRLKYNTLKFFVNWIAIVYKKCYYKYMDINEYRKLLFLKSQYCTYYKVNNNTVLAGIMRSDGYRYTEILSDDKLKDVNKSYRKYTALLNLAVAVEIILYVYLVIFPYYLEFMKLPFFAVVMMLSIVPLVALYLTYIAVNASYENYLTKKVGAFQKMKFQPKVKYIEDDVFNAYLKTTKKSIFFLALIILVFFAYLVTPLIINSFNSAKNYNSALKLSNKYLTLMPVAPDVYAQRAYAKFKLKQYKEAVEDYEKANQYSFSEDFKYDILGVKTFYLPYDQVLNEFDNVIALEKDKPYKYYLMIEKAAYKLKNKDYKSAYNTFNYLIALYEKGNKVFFSPSYVYNNRGIAREYLGDKAGAKADFTISKKMCPECKYTLDSTIVNQP